MKISVTVKPNKKENKVKKNADGTFEVWITAPPTEGKANKAVIQVLAKYFKVGKSAVSISVGAKGRKKIVEII